MGREEGGEKTGKQKWEQRCPKESQKQKRLSKYLKTVNNCDSWLRMLPEALCIRSDI